MLKFEFRYSRENHYAFRLQQLSESTTRMSDTRNYEIIRTTKTQDECTAEMTYPYSYIDEFNGPHSNYPITAILYPILVETEAERADPGDFPKNIQEHFWVRVGENDGDSWLSAGQLTNGAYFYYSGGCDYTGFDCQGGMNLWVSKSWKNIVDHAMTEEEYELYIHQNEPSQNPAICECGDKATLHYIDSDHPHLCADCYWDLDEKYRREARGLPV